MSISPEPQIPAGLALPIVRIMGSRVVGLICTCSMAPLPARMPNLMPPPSKAGPAEQEAQVSQSLLPTTSSPFVPISMKSVTSDL